MVTPKWKTKSDQRRCEEAKPAAFGSLRRRKEAKAIGMDWKLAMPRDRIRDSRGVFACILFISFPRGRVVSVVRHLRTATARDRIDRR